ncbi:hypothetical protein Ahia01_000689300 [Argonauta hians]
MIDRFISKIIPITYSNHIMLVIPVIPNSLLNIVQINKLLLILLQVLQVILGNQNILKQQPRIGFITWRHNENIFGKH